MLAFRPPLIPEELLDALRRAALDLRYTAAEDLYYYVNPDYRDIAVGVFGDGPNGSYEWFIWDHNTQQVRTSNCGFGLAGVALCHGLVEVGAHTANGSHDLFLAWKRKSIVGGPAWKPVAAAPANSPTTPEQDGPKT